uniref:DUF6475 domain-containing protein n=1 Tax=viral metagenome TaxID=1070528 RepID=A0A6M3IVP5_9ZZZZ
MLDRNEFIKTMVGLYDMYGKVPSEFILDTYYGIFEEYTAEEFNKAVMKCLKEKVYNSVPKPAEIIEFLEGTKDDKALIAWNQVLDAIRKGGYYSSVEFYDPIIPACINELGGWQWIGSQQHEDMVFIEKRFMILYRLFLKRGTEDNHRMIGFIEASNGRRGYLDDIPAPIKIGFPREQTKQITTSST